jgi:hypothetical protein
MHILINSILIFFKDESADMRLKGLSKSNSIQTLNIKNFASNFDPYFSSIENNNFPPGNNLMGSIGRDNSNCKFLNLKPFRLVLFFNLFLFSSTRFFQFQQDATTTTATTVWDVK